MTHTFRPGDRVRVRGCRGSAKVEKFCKKYDVYLLDRVMVRRYSDGNGAEHYVGYGTWPAADLTKVEMGGKNG